MLEVGMQQGSLIRRYRKRGPDHFLQADLNDTHRRSHARFLLRLVQQATEEMQWVYGSFHLQTKLRSQQPEPVLLDFRFAGLRR